MRNFNIALGILNLIFCLEGIATESYGMAAVNLAAGALILLTLPPKPPQKP